jgi:hypothetical protein
MINTEPVSVTKNLNELFERQGPIAALVTSSQDVKMYQIIQDRIGENQRAKVAPLSGTMGANFTYDRSPRNQTIRPAGQECRVKKLNKMFLCIIAPLQERQRFR